MTRAGDPPMLLYLIHYTECWYLVKGSGSGCLRFLERFRLFEVCSKCLRFVPLRSVCGFGAHTRRMHTTRTRPPPGGPRRARRPKRKPNERHQSQHSNVKGRPSSFKEPNAIMHQGSGIACVWPPAPEAHHRWGTRCLVLTIPTPTTSSSRQPVRPKRLRSYSCSGNTDGILAVVRCGPASREGIPNKKGRCDRVGAMVKSVNAG